MDNSVVLENRHHEEFYSPLSLKGYLTPLQRQKLREKRGVQFSQIEQKAKISEEFANLRKRKKERSTNISMKNKKENKIIKPKKKNSHLRYVAAKVVSKSTDSIKNKKFFKTSPSHRLERARFSLTLDVKSNLMSKLNKCIEEQLLYSKQRPDADKHNYEPIEHLDKEDFKENSADYVNVSPKDSKLEMKVKPDENSLFEFDWPSDEILLKRQEVARSNLKKQCILKESALKVQTIQDQEESVAKPVKLYPIFYHSEKKKYKDLQNDKRKPKNTNSVCGQRARESMKGGEQMIIDAGQKDIGAKICNTCNMIYTVGHREDVKLHTAYHNMYMTNLKFPGWKDETVIGEYRDGRIIMVKRDDHLSKIKKIEDILAVANRDLGFSSAVLPTKPDITFILFISNTKQVAGCIIAEPISRANRVVLSDKPSSDSVKEDSTWRIGCWYSGPETVQAVCGINRIWVAHEFRRCKIASRMIDCLRCHFIHGHVIGIRELAFTDPSPVGRQFAAAYTGTDNFLVYR